MEQLSDLAKLWLMERMNSEYISSKLGEKISDTFRQEVMDKVINPPKNDGGGEN